MNIFIKTFMIFGLTTGIALYAAQDAGQQFISKTSPTYATFTEAQEVSPLSISVTNEHGDKYNSLSDMSTAHDSPFQQLFNTRGELARFAHDFYGSCTQAQQRALDARHTGSTKPAVRKRATRDSDESDSQSKKNDLMAEVTHVVVQDATKELVSLFNDYVKKRQTMHQQQIESLTSNHERKTRRTSCCAAISSMATIIVTNTVTSYLTKKYH